MWKSQKFLLLILWMLLAESVYCILKITSRNLSVQKLFEFISVNILDVTLLVATWNNHVIFCRTKHRIFTNISLDYSAKLRVWPYYKEINKIFLKKTFLSKINRLRFSYTYKFLRARYLSRGRELYNQRFYKLKTLVVVVIAQELK